MDPELSRVIYFAAQAFASGAAQQIVSSVASGVTARSEQERLLDIYRTACNEACESLGERTADEVRALANFLGSETVLTAMTQFLTSGEVDRIDLGAEWRQEGGSPEDFDTAFDALTAALKREALASASLGERLTAGVIRSDLSVISDTLTGLIPTQSGEIEAAEGRIAELESAVLREFDARVAEAIAMAKEKRLYASAKGALERLANEAESRSEVLANSDLMNKLYVNLTVCAERLGDFDETLKLAEAAVEQKPEDSRSLTNLAVAKVKRSDRAVGEASVLVDRAIQNDDAYRPAVILKLVIIAEMEGAEHALEYASRLEWLSDDGGAQYTLGSIFLRAGDREAAVECARRAVELEPKSDHLAWLAHLLARDEVGPETSAVYVDIRGLEATKPHVLEESLDLLRRAADQYEAEELKGHAEAIRIDIARVLIRLERVDDAEKALQDLAKSSTTDAAGSAAYLNLIELKLPANPESALVTAEEARSRFPDRPALRFARARALEANQRDPRCSRGVEPPCAR